MDKRKHVVVAGTGRSGTTVLVELLTHLGLDTGFTPDSLLSGKYKYAEAGLEHDLRKENCPYIVKDPNFGSYAQAVLDRGNVEIEHVFIPIRDIHAAAESRRFVVRTNIENMKWWERLAYVVKPREFAGGVQPSKEGDLGALEYDLLMKIHGLMLALSRRMIPVTLVHYPTLIKDPGYLFQKLNPILAHVDYGRFQDVFARTVNPSLAHQFGCADS